MLHRITKGLKKERLNEDLVLDNQARIPGQIVQYLASFQLHGIRFLYKHYVKKSNCILNDDKHMGKCFQTTVFLSTITCSNLSAFRCLIICKSRVKLLNWLYHIELLTNLKSVEYKSIGDFQNHNILVQLVEEIQNKQNLATTKLWDYVILDETGEYAFTDNDAVLLKQIETKAKLIVSTIDITQNVRHLKRLLMLLNGKDYFDDIFKHIKLKFRKSNDYIHIRELLICYCKSFLLRRYSREIIKNLPLIDFAIYQKNFNSWRNSKDFINDVAVDYYSQTQINPSNILSHSQNTEEMAPLVLESDTEDEFEELRELMEFERKSSDVEIFTQKLPSPITLSSENPYQRQSSPDLFESLDEEDSEKTTNYELYELTGSLFKFKKKFNNVQVSTPKAFTTQWSSLKQQNSDDLFEGIASMNEGNEDNTHIDNGKLFEETNHTCIFEITKNDEFPNVIRINSDTEMSPVDKHNKPKSKLAADMLNSKAKNSLEDRKYNKNFHYFFDNDENVQNSVELIDENTNYQCVTPKSCKTPNTSGSSSNSNRWIGKNCSSVKRKLSESFGKLQSKRLKNHDIVKLQDNPNKCSIEKKKTQTVSDKLSISGQVADSCSILFKKSKFKRFLSHTLASSDEEF